MIGKTRDIMQKQQDDGAKVFAELASTADAHHG
jgi:hypothetical protein